MKQGLTSLVIPTDMLKKVDEFITSKYEGEQTKKGIRKSQSGALRKLIVDGLKANGIELDIVAPVSVASSNEPNMNNPNQS